MVDLEVVPIQGVSKFRFHEDPRRRVSWDEMAMEMPRFISQKNIVEPVRVEAFDGSCAEIFQNDVQLIPFIVDRVREIERAIPFAPNDTASKVSLVFMDIDGPVGIFLHDVFRVVFFHVGRVMH